MAKFRNKHESASQKLTDVEVVEIRRRYAEEGLSQGELGREYDVTIQTIGRIVRGESRTKLKLPERMLTSEEINAQAAEMFARVQARMQAEAATVPIAKEKRADIQLNQLLSDRARAYGVKEDSE